MPRHASPWSDPRGRAAPARRSGLSGRLYGEVKVGRIVSSDLGPAADPPSHRGVDPWRSPARRGGGLQNQAVHCAFKSTQTATAAPRPRRSRAHLKHPPATGRRVCRSQCRRLEGPQCRTNEGSACPSCISTATPPSRWAGESRATSVPGCGRARFDTVAVWKPRPTRYKRS